jgi:hypothetical protein
MFQFDWSVSAEVKTFLPWLCVLLVTLTIVSAAIVLFVKKWLVALPLAVVAFFATHYVFERHVIYTGRLEDVVLMSFLFFAVLFGQQWRKWNG